MVAAASVSIRDTGVAVSEEGNDIDVSVKYTQLMPRFEFVAKVCESRINHIMDQLNQERTKRIFCSKRSSRKT